MGHVSILSHVLQESLLLLYTSCLELGESYGSNHRRNF